MKFFYFFVRRMLKQKLLQHGVVVLAGICLLGQALTGGRAGYVTWACIGFVEMILVSLAGAWVYRE